MTKYLKYCFPNIVCSKYSTSSSGSLGDPGNDIGK